MRSQGGSVRGVGGHGGRDVGREVEHGETERVQGSGFVRAVPAPAAVQRRAEPPACCSASTIRCVSSGKHPGVLTEHDTE